MTIETDNAAPSTVELATELTVAWLGNHNTRISAEEVPAFMRSMYDALTRLATPTGAEAEPAEEHVAAVTVHKSLASPDHIISMIDGKPYKTLRRHLSTRGLTPEEYRARYNLKPDYPMVAPTYSEARRTMAKSIGLGRKPGQSATPKADEAVSAKAKRPPRPRSKAKDVKRENDNG